MQGDIADPSVRETALSGIDTVVHLATRSYSADIEPTPEEIAYEENVTLNLVKESIHKGVKRFIYLSSIHVYGESLEGDIDEDTPLAPRRLYGKTRLNIERGISQISNPSMNTVLIRLTNAFGVPAIPREETWNLLLHDLCRQAATNRTISLRSDDRICRDLMAMRDVVEVLSEIIISPRITSGIYLLASGQSMSLGEIASLVVRLAQEELGVQRSIQFAHRKTISPPTFTLHSRRLRELGIAIPQRRDEEIRDLLRYARDTTSGRST
jgi:UDP-glucose 4-epimerase